MAEKLSYSFHLSNDKSKTKKGKQIPAKFDTPGYSNNAIQNLRDLSKVNHHNLRQYENNPELIHTIRGSDNIVDDIKKLYKEEFEEARLEYNKKQNRDDRKIDSYIHKISNDTKHDLACEIIIELGNMEFWANKTMQERYKMSLVFEEQVQDLEKIVPQFKIANATIHYDESSPHLHIVGIAIKDNCKTGMTKQVGKTAVFTKDSLKMVQDKMRECCINSYNKHYLLNTELKPKKKGRNRDYKSNQMSHYDEFVKDFNDRQEVIEKTKNITNNLDNKTDEIKEIIYDLKGTPFNNFTITSVNRNKLLDYLDTVDNTSDKMKEITNYAISVNQIKKDFEDNYEKIDILEEELHKKDIKIKSYDRVLENKDITIERYKKENKQLKTENNALKELVDRFKKAFNKIVNFFDNMLFKDKHTRERYIEVARDLYNEDIFKDSDIERLEETYEFNVREDKRKQRDRGFER